MATEKKVHGNTGKQNAKKDVTKNAVITFRIESEKKTAYLNHVKNHGGGKLEHWLIQLADEELKRESN